MKALLRKEFTLSLFPLPYCFWLLAGLLLIPNYPYFVTFFYAALGVMFLFQYNRENRDLNYMLLFTRSRADGEGGSSRPPCIELGMLVACLPFMAVRGLYSFLNNQVGFEANHRLFAGAGEEGSAAPEALTDFPAGFYRDGRDIGLPFLFGSLAPGGLYAGDGDPAPRYYPLFCRWCDRMDLAAQLHQLPVLAVGLAVYALLTLWALRISIRRFVRIDL